MQDVASLRIVRTAEDDKKRTFVTSCNSFVHVFEYGGALWRVLSKAAVDVAKNWTLKYGSGGKKERNKGWGGE